MKSTADESRQRPVGILDPLAGRILERCAGTGSQRLRDQRDRVQNQISFEESFLPCQGTTTRGRS